MKNLFLEGNSGTGKTTLILDSLGKRMEYAGGFSVARLHEDNGRCAGFRVRRAQGVKAADEPVDDDSEGIFIRFLPEKGYRDTSTFTSLAGKYLEESRDSRFILLDEFGGMELKDSEFVGKLRRVVASDTPCIGVIKSRENALHMMKCMPDREDFEREYDELREYMEKETNTLIFRLTANNKEEAEKLIAEWMETNDVGNI